MQAVAYLDKDNPNVIAHRKKQFLEILCLRRCLLTEYSTRNLCQSVNNLCYLVAENIRNVFNRIVGILDNIVKQCRTDTCRTEPHLRTCNLGYGNRVHYVRFARKAADTLMRLFGKMKSLGYQIDLLTVARRQIAVQQMLERVINQFLLGFFPCFINIVLLVHNRVFICIIMIKVKGKAQSVTLP